MRTAIAAAVLLAAACAHAPKPQPTAACQTVPQWIMTGPDGQPGVGVFVCFGEDHRVLWTSRLLTDAERAARAPGAGLQAVGQ